MELLKKGNGLKREYIGECRNCFAIYKASQIEFDNGWTVNDSLSEVSCPECDSYNTIGLYFIDSNKGKEILHKI